MELSQRQTKPQAQQRPERPEAIRALGSLVRGTSPQLAAAGEPTPPSRTFSFVCSTETFDRNGRIVVQDWDLTEFAKNPIVLWNHGVGGGFFSDVTTEEYFPIGRASNVRVEGGELKADITIGSEKANPLAERIFHALNEGLLNAVSVGWYPNDVRYETHDGQEVVVMAGNTLMEISVVPMPANPDAVRASFCGRARALANPQKESNMNVTVFAALGLHSDATDTQVSERIRELTEVEAAMLQSTGTKTAKEARAKLIAMAETVRAHDELVAQVEAAKAEQRQAKIEAAIKAGREAGKLTPANEPGLLKALCGDETGAKADPDSLALLIANLPQVVNLSPASTKDEQASGPTPTASEKARAAKLGIDPVALAAERMKLAAELAAGPINTNEDEA